jgi:eukaryotic-like serine/threonine-protein kinase
MAVDIRQIEELFHAAMSFAPAERAAYLDSACGAEIRQELDSLIEAFESDGGRLEDSAVTMAMRLLASDDDPEAMLAQQVGPYRILSTLGHGGMGTVYLAEDTHLNRKVALKFIASDFVSDNWGKRQLMKEAQAVARLDHPNICAVYDFDEIDDHSFIVMQYIEGQTLADLIRTAPLENDQLITLAQQIVSALGDAHAHGIIHRDIKPKNIMVTPSGQVKVLDFGLAKTIPKTFEDITESVSQLSKDGLLIGTVAYMSPEQLRGERLDFRSDIFSMGTVLYEMACRKNPYAHKSNAEVISAIMSRDPEPLRQVSIQCPRDLEHIVDKCLRKDRDERYQSAAELLIDLDNVQRGIALPRTRPYVGLRIAAFAAMLLLALVVIAFMIYQQSASAGQTLGVLPIVCEGLEPGTQCMGPAMTENLARVLGNRKGLRVTTSRVEPSLFGPQAASPEKVGRDLNVDTVLYGRIRRGENGLILTVRLQNVKDGSRIAEENYALNPDETSTLGQRLSLDTAYYLHLPMNEDDKNLFSVLAAAQNRNVQAIDLYREGRIYWSKRDWDNIKKAINSFQQATEKDPLYARAWAGLADCYVLMNTVAFSPADRKDAMKRAEYAAKQALDIDPNLAEAHTANGAVLMKNHWDWEAAEKEFKRAIALNPDYSPAHWAYSNLLGTVGRFNESIAEATIVKDLDPFSPPAVLNYCRAYYFARQFDQAYPCYEQLSQDYPNFTSGKYSRGITYVLQGRYPEAIQIFEEFYAKDKALGGAMLGFTYALVNRREDAERVLREMQELQKTQNLPPQELAIIYMGLNDLDHALPLFRKAVEERYPPTQTIFIDPMFDRLRADPRFAELAKEVRLPLRETNSAAGQNTSAK